MQLSRNGTILNHMYPLSNTSWSEIGSKESPILGCLQERDSVLSNLATKSLRRYMLELNVPSAFHALHLQGLDMPPSIEEILKTLFTIKTLFMLTGTYEINNRAGCKGNDWVVAVDLRQFLFLAWRSIENVNSFKILLQIIDKRSEGNFKILQSTLHCSAVGNINYYNGH